MDQFDKMKVERQAMNGKMCLMFGGIFLIFSAITSTLMYGINFFMTALEADKGTAEYVELLENAGLQSDFLKGIGICFVAVGIWEVVVGFFATKNSNRVDKSKISVKLSLSLLVVEVLLQVILFLKGLMNLGLLFTAVILPLFLLWGATRLGKVAKAEPERKFAVDPGKKKVRQQSQLLAAPKKSIRERAAMQARVEERETKENKSGEMEGMETAETIAEKNKIEQNSDTEQTAEEQNSDTEQTAEEQNSDTEQTIAEQDDRIE